MKDWDKDEKSKDEFFKQLMPAIMDYIKKGPPQKTTIAINLEVTSKELEEITKILNKMRGFS